MFESDQHEFDEEYEGYRHPAPPSPPPAAPTPAQTQPAPTPQAAPVQQPVFQETRRVEVQEEPEEEEDPHALAYEEQENEEFVDAAERKTPLPPKKQPNLMLYAGFAALAIFGIVAFYLVRPKQNTPQAGDMGPGIVAADGLRGHLQTQWDGDAKTGKLDYQLRIEPMEDRWQAGFSHVVVNPPMPLSVNIRLLDSTGFALCGKEVEFRFDPQKASIPIPTLAADKKMSKAERAAALEAARQSQITQMQAAEATREHGKDIFQNQTTTDNQVSAVNVQGTLPCSPDQYRRADYWDFNTNFPTLQEQAMLLDPKGALARGEFTPPPHPGRRTLSRMPQVGFVIQGDDRITGYDSAHGTLWAEGKTFQIDKRFGQATATAWANNYSLIHYRCDQQANCALTAAGEAAVLHARLNE